jgi:hypothetical protein
MFTPSLRHVLSSCILLVMCTHTHAAPNFCFSGVPNGGAAGVKPLNWIACGPGFAENQAACAGLSFTPDLTSKGMAQVVNPGASQPSGNVDQLASQHSQIIDAVGKTMAQAASGSAGARMRTATAAQSNRTGMVTPPVQSPASKPTSNPALAAKEGGGAPAAAVAFPACSELAKPSSCKATQARGDSEHSYAVVSLPESRAGAQIVVKAGAYNRYVFPKCNRVTWTDLAFVCGGDGRWSGSGKFDADAFCTNANTNQPYLTVGDK